MTHEAKTIVVVVKNGRVDNVYCNTSGVLVDVIDLDTQDTEEIQDLENELADVKRRMVEVWS